MDSKHHSQYNNQEDDSMRYPDQVQNKTGKRLRLDGGKRTEEECRQMLRLAEVENKELKDSLRYVEIQLGKTRENYAGICKKYEEAQEEINKCHEQINRQTNINHAQASQITELSSKMDHFVSSQKEMYEKSKFKVSAYQNEIDIREEEINRTKRQIAQRDEDLKMMSGRMATMSERLHDIEEELELKSGENNRLRNQVADLEKSVQDLYVSRKGDGSFQVEIEGLKADNERLIMLMRNTTEYQNMPESEILREAKNLTTNKSKLNSSSLNNSRSGGLNKSRAKSNEGTRTSSANQIGGNEWIPTDAVRAIQKIKSDFSAQMTETCVSQILYELNAIWRAIMRKESDSMKRKFTDQIQDLRRQLITKKAFDEQEASKEISRLKRELAFSQQQSHKRKAMSGAASNASSQKENQGVPTPLSGLQQNSHKQQSQKNHQKDVNQGLKKKITDLENQRIGMYHSNDMISDDISSSKFGGGMVINSRAGQLVTMQDEILSGKNIFNYQQMAHHTNSGREGHHHQQDNISQSFHYSDYS